MFSKVKEIEERFNEIEKELVRPDVLRDQKVYQKYLKEHSKLCPIIEAYRKYAALEQNLENNHSLLEDPDGDIRKLAKEEIEVFKVEMDRILALTKMHQGESQIAIRPP